MLSFGYSNNRTNKEGEGITMKKSILVPIFLIIVVLVVGLSACKKKKPEVQEPVKDLEEPIEDVVSDEMDREEIMKDFNNLVESKNEPDKIVAFIDKEINKLTNIEGDKMISQLERNLEKSLDLITDKISSLDLENELIHIGGSELFFPESKVKDIQNDELKKEVQKALDSNYKLINLEGSFYPIIDYEKLQKYNKNISPELMDYITIRAMDSNSPVAIDGGLYISFDELAGRIFKSEDYLQKYSGGQRHEEMLKNYRSKLEIYLLGMDNSPISDDEIGKIKEEVLESYKKTANTKDKVTAYIVRKYLNSIEENEYIIDDNVTKNILSLINESISLLEETK